MCICRFFLYTFKIYWQFMPFLLYKNKWSIFATYNLFFVFRLDYRPEQGRYDLLIKNTTYERENGRFECRIKASGSGISIHSQAYNLTVLTVPQAPRVSPGARVQVTEGREQRLSCSSSGASPDPVFRSVVTKLSVKILFIISGSVGFHNSTCKETFQR